MLNVNFRALLNVASRLRAREKEFDSFNQALQDSGVGYNSELIAEVVFKKTLNFVNLVNRDNLLPASPLGRIAFPISQLMLMRKQRFNIIDFGGACGYHYFIARKLLPFDIKFNYVVIETEQMVKRAVELENEELRFATNFKETAREMGEIDLFFSSSTLQYLEQPFELLRSVMSYNPFSCFITRVPMGESDNRYFLQESRLSANGPGQLPDEFTDRTITYPLTIVSRKQIRSILGAKYPVCLEVEEKEETIRLGSLSFPMRGFYSAQIGRESKRP
jgi:putative methyltransferase (TIGR04325 family)